MTFELALRIVELVGVLLIIPLWRSVSSLRGNEIKHVSENLVRIEAMLVRHLEYHAYENPRKARAKPAQR